jgi:divalent metal cation (Fe/Co/Zn/Cd) transporter
MRDPGLQGISTLSSTRARLVGRGLRLEIFTVGWNVIEAIVAIVAALTAGSVALFGFGADSVIESASGGILIWRLVAESRAPDAAAIARLDRTAHKLVGTSLLLLAAYVAGDAAHALWVGQHPEPSRLGMGVTLVSLVVMMWLARAKRRAAKALDSRALEADAFQTTMCWWLSLITLTGIGLNAALGWWWADPVAALGMTLFLVHEGREAWRGGDCCA